MKTKRNIVDPQDHDDMTLVAAQDNPVRTGRVNSKPQERAQSAASSSRFTWLVGDSPGEAREDQGQHPPREPIATRRLTDQPDGERSIVRFEEVGDIY